MKTMKTNFRSFSCEGNNPSTLVELANGMTLYGLTFWGYTYIHGRRIPLFKAPDGMTRTKNFFANEGLSGRLHGLTFSTKTL